ncbi:Tia invasion determinant [endosymbiont of Acanthamoeba sp. UWC8]|uniref:outer membrane protein n=1 Tax=endosymbiont of Acanthamoeba sp. UWC8 TaxID=86106 RepID=UPI0004D1CF9D|nr:outer membrane beta-barrel protein [endosymbiont of Acanthamoeba sp. UWC8]AIF81560.1 Tia invasion determinant [endosymbiont of Acanthamoeba sp. UWC8]
MLKKILVLLIVLVPNFASANDSFYAKVGLGYLKPNKNSSYSDSTGMHKNNSFFTNNYLFDAGIGYQVSDAIEVGLTFQHGKSRLNAGSLGDTAHPITTVDENGNPIRIDSTPFAASKLKITTTALLANVNYNLGKIYNFSPYIFAGAGMARHKYRSTDSQVNCLEEISNSYRAVDYKIPGKVQNNFAWSVGIGGHLPINEQLYLDLALRYYDYGQIKAENKKYINGIMIDNVGTAKVKIKGAMFLVGITVKF